MGEPSPPTCPRGPSEGFEEDPTQLAMRGRDVTQKGMASAPAASYNQWISFVRLERRRFGEGANLESMHREYRDAVAAYGERWQSAQGRESEAYNRAIADGTWAKGTGKRNGVKGAGGKPDRASPKRKRRRR